MPGASCCVACQWIEPSSTDVTDNDALICRLRVSTVDLGVGIKKSPENVFRYDQQGATKEPLPIYIQAKADASGIKMAWTDNSVAGVFDAARIHITDFARGQDGSLTKGTDRVIPGREVRGMYTHFSGWTAVLVRTSVDELYPGTAPSGNRAAFVQNMEIRKYRDSDGVLLWSTTLEDDQDGDNYIGRIHDFSLGDGRLEYGEGKLGMYYKVSTGQMDNWHEGDTYKEADASTGAVTTVVGWGCSHSMGMALSYNPGTKSFGRSCVTDAFPTKGLFLSGTKLKAIDANQGGRTDGGVGQVVNDHDDGFLVIFTAPQVDNDIVESGAYTSQMAPTGPGSDVGVVRVSTSGVVIAVKWLTSTVGIDEMGSHMTEYGPDEFLVGWRVGDYSDQRNSGVCGASGVKYYVATIRRSDLSFVKEPEEVTKIAPFMERDGWTTFANGHGAWAAPGGADKQAVVKYETEVNEVQFTTMLAPTAGTCGNGEVDFWAGETCDDTSSCCENCQLVAGAQCSAGFCCDVLTCRYKPTTVTCALDKDENFNVAGCSASNTANCGSCYNGACSRFSGQTKGNTDWCPATGGCMQRIAYDFGNGPTCTGSFYNGAKTVPAGAVCAISGSQQQLCEITGTDTAICGAAADPIPAYSVQPPCPFCSTPAGTPCALRATWEEVDAMQLAGTQVHTGGLGEQMTAEYESWLCLEMACAPDDLACFKYSETRGAFDWFGFNSVLRIVAVTV